MKIKCLGVVELSQWSTQVRVLETVKRHGLIWDKVTERERVYTCCINEHRWFDEDGRKVGHLVAAELYAILAKNMLSNDIDRFINSL